MHQARWSAVACIAALLGCSAEQEPLVSGKGLSDEKEPTQSVDAGKGGKRDAGIPKSEDDDDQSEEDEPVAPIPSNRADAGEDNCGHDTVHTEIKSPDIMIVLDRSGSMRNEGVDRWAPSVAAIKKLTIDFASDISFGLLTFPGAAATGRGGNGCAPGAVQVPIGKNKGPEIARVLDGTQPGGGTPTGQALQTALSEFMKAHTADVAPPERFVLLVTDGQPTCPAASGGGVLADPASLMADKQLTLTALESLAKAEIKTFVIGYDAQLDPQFASSLTEFAQRGGTERYYPVQDEASLAQAFMAISRSVIPCEAKITSNVIGPEYVHVTLDGKDELKYDDPDGFRIEGDTVFIQGAACAALQMGKGHKVDIVVDCMRIE